MERRTVRSALDASKGSAGMNPDATLSSSMAGIGARRARRLFWISVAMIVVATLQSAVAQERPKNFILHETPKPLAAIVFQDGEGRSRSLPRGKVVLLNIWATWIRSWSTPRWSPGSSIETSKSPRRWR
jgi:hypothetical protein